MIDLTVIGRMPSGVQVEHLSRLVEQAFRAARRKPEGCLCIAFVSEAEIAKMNRRFRSEPHVTDVLSFPAPNMPRGGTLTRDWGDILLAPSYIRREARRRAIPFAEEVMRDMAHGILHLFGFDHQTAAEELRMFSLQERILASLENL